MKDPNSAHGNTFDKLLAITQSEKFLSIRPKIITESLFQREYLEGEKFHKFAGEFDLRCGHGEYCLEGIPHVRDDLGADPAVCGGAGRAGRLSPDP